jgi:hypothetical protein
MGKARLPEKNLPFVPAHEDMVHDVIRKYFQPIISILNKSLDSETGVNLSCR